MAQTARSTSGISPSRVAPTSAGPAPTGPAPVSPAPEGNQSRMEGIGLARRPSETTLANDFTENVGDSELDVCADVEGYDAATTARLSGLRRGVEAALAPWAQQRASSNLHFDVTELNARMSAFVADWQTRGSGQSIEEAVRRTLDVGTIRASLAEIAAFEINLYWAYLDFLDITPSDIPVHQYTLVPRASADAGELVGATSTAATLRYRNSHGMGWSVDGVIATGGLRASVGADLSADEDEASGNFGAVGFSLGESPMEAQPTRVYFSPEDFGWATVLDMEAAAGGEVSSGAEGLTASIGRASSARMLLIEGGGHTLEFRSLENDQATDDTSFEAGAPELTPNAGVEGTIRSEGGLVVPTGPAIAESDVQPLETAGTRPDPTMQVQARLHFATGDARLDAEDLVTLQDLVDQMYSGVQRFHGALYEIELVGFASRQWRAARTPEQALEHNRDLAGRRVSAARRTLAALIDGQDVDFNERIEEEFDRSVQEDFANVRALSTTTSSSDVQGDGGGPENDPEYRAVEIMVTWHPCRSSERVDSMRL